MPTIIVQDLQHVLVDGSNFGAVSDTISNNKDIASDVQRSLVAWQKTLSDEHDSALSKIVADRDSAQKALADLQALTSSILAQAKLIDHPATQALVAEVEKEPKQRQKEALLAQAAELQKQADAIG